MKRDQIIILALIIAAVGLAVGLGRRTAVIHLVNKEGEYTRLTVELAETQEERQRGLMYRQSIGRFDGMLFISEQPEVMRFWMKNTLIPLDIIFFNAAGDFVSSVSMPPCVDDPCPLYESQSQAKFALEVPEGFAKENEVKMGWKLEL